MQLTHSCRLRTTAVVARVWVKGSSQGRRMKLHPTRRYFNLVCQVLLWRRWAKRSAVYFSQWDSPHLQPLSLPLRPRSQLVD
jgi:hypothetical protein